MTSNEDQTFSVILNSLRIDNGVCSVSYDSRLHAAAQGHAEDMASNGYFSHDADGDDDDGVDTNLVGDRVTAQGYDWINVGENIGGGGEYGTEQQMLNGWEGSTTGHFEVMTSPVFEEFGLGVAGSGNDIRWVLVLATED